MGRNLELSHLTEEECERILQVMQRDFDLRQTEKGRLDKIEEEIKEEDSKVAILTQQKNFNNNCCIRCFSKFIFIINQKVQCLQCQHFVCKSCSTYLTQEKQYACNVCQKQRELGAQSCNWFYSNIRQKFKRFGSAKVVRSLYKRKTDSDSENDSGYDPSQHSNSLPVGKRPRRTIEGFFVDLTNTNISQQDYQSTNAATADDGAAKEDGEDYGVSGHVAAAGPCFASGDVASGYDATREETGMLYAGGSSRDSESELTAFRASLNHVVDDVHRTLDKNVTTPDISNGEPPSQYDLLALQRKRLCRALSDLAYGLRSTSGVPTAEMHEKVDEKVLHEVQRYLGHDVPLGDATCRQPGTAQWDQLAATIIHRVLRARWEADERLHKREEEKVRRDLTKLSNQCTITQLTDMLGESDDTHNSTFAETDNESHFSEQPDTESPFTRTPQHEGISNVIDVNQCDSDVDLDDLVALNSNVLRTAETLHISEPQRMSMSSHESTETTITVTTPEGETMRAAADESKGDFLDMVTRNTQVCAAVEGSGEDSNVTIGTDSEGQVPVRELLITRSQATRENIMPCFDNDCDIANDPDLDVVWREEAALRLSTWDRVPLPSFDGSDSMLGLDEVDLDDISRHGDDDDEELTMESEIHFECTSWEVTKPDRLFKSPISAYDNFGKRKVGKDVDGPVFMMVPGESVQSPTIGEQTLDNLSDLSENEAGSQTLSDFLSDSEDEDLSPHTSDLAVQTDNLELESDNMQANAAQDYMTMGTAVVTDATQTNNSNRKMSATSAADEAQLELMRRKRLEEASLAAELVAEEEEDPEDADPRFVVRPRTVTVPVGEPARITCHVTGTKPMDVFWYREGAEVDQLEEDEQTEVHTHDDCHTLELFNTTETTAGRYVCIAISDKGHSHRAFRVKVTKNCAEQAAPEFLKEIRDAEVLEGSGASFRCKVKGRPQPRISWYKDRTRLRSDHQYRIQKQGNRDYVMSIDCVTMDDDAEYSVIARNIAGEARTSVQLLVEAKTDDFGRPIEQPVLNKARLAADTETSRKYAALEEQGEREVMSARSTYPDTAELLRIAEQVHTTRTRGAAGASPTRPTEKLSTIHGQIDEMDKKLHSLEDDIHTSLISRSDSLLSRSDSLFLRSDSEDSTNNNSAHSMPVTNSLRQSILRENDEMRCTAASMRQVTSSALEVLTSSDALMKAANCINRSDPEQTMSKTIRSGSTSGESLVIERSPIVGSPGCEEEQEELHLCYADFELLYQNAEITKEQLKSGKFGRHDGQRLLKRLEELKRTELEKDASRDDSVEEEVLDCGLKRVPSKRYKRDYIVNRSPVPQKRKMLGVSGVGSPLATSPMDVMRGATRKEALNDVEESGLSLAQIDLQEPIVEEESPYDATTADEVSKIEKQVSNIQQRARGGSASSPSESPVTGTSPPISQLEALAVVKPPEVVVHKAGDNPNEEAFVLPSVKNLRSLFNVDDGAGVRRVYSLTGRDLPKVVRDKLREQGPNVVASSNVRRQEDARKRQTASQVFSATVEDQAQPARHPDVLLSEHTSTAAPLSSTPHGATPPQLSSLDHSCVSSPSAPSSPFAPMSIGSSRSGATSPTSPTSVTSGATSPTSPTPQSWAGPMKPAIKSRTKYWDDRIREGKSSDKQAGAFPALSEDVFKREAPKTSILYAATASWKI